jgi:hypothetical protein
MDTTSRKRLLAVTTGVLALGLPLTLLSLLLLLNPYAILLGTEFTVVNGLDEPIEVTPVGVLRMASGEYQWRVVPQLAVSFLAAPPRREVQIPVPAGENIPIRANFDDISLAAIAVDSAGKPGRVLIVDDAAAIGQCCYPPRHRRIVVSKEGLSPATTRLAAAVTRAREADRALGWYAWCAAGLAVGVLFVLSLRAQRAMARRPDSRA